MCELPVHKKVAFNVTRHSSLLCTIYSIFAGKNVSIFFSDYSDLFFHACIFSNFFWPKVVFNTCIIDYLKLKNDVHAPLSVDR